MEPLEFDDDIKPGGKVPKPWALTGASGREALSVKSLFLGQNEKSLERHNEKLQEKYREIVRSETEAELYMIDDAEKILVAYGSMGRIARSCVDALREGGQKVGLVRPKTLWPFPSADIKAAAARGAKFLVVEMSAGQMVEDVRLAVSDDSRVLFYGRAGGGIPREEAIMKKVREL